MNCRKPLIWEECNACEGIGGVDGYAIDPNWWHPGELAPCTTCNSNGGWWCHDDELTPEVEMTLDDCTHSKQEGKNP